MIIGLQRNKVELSPHNPEWSTLAAQTVKQLQGIFGSVAKDIQHVGSTSIKNIQAKPIIDIAVAIEDFAKVEALVSKLESNGFIQRCWPFSNHMLFSAGINIGAEDSIKTHNIHIAKAGSTSWYNFINFRDYLNANPSVAKIYESIKLNLASANPYDEGRAQYLAGKNDFIIQTLHNAKKYFNLEEK